MRKIISSMMAVQLCLCAMASEKAAAQEGGDPAVSTPGPQLPSQTLTANSGPSPYTLKLQYTGEAWDNAAGGLRTGTAYLHNVDAQVYINTDKAFGWTGGSFLGEAFYANSRSIDTQYVGSAQDPSVIDTTGISMVRLYQLYYKQNWGDTNLLVGIYDLETEFGSSRPMELFFNGAYAWTFTLDQSGLTGPSTYPNTAPAIRLKHYLSDDWSVQAAVLDGVSDSLKKPDQNSIIFNKRYGLLAIGEVDYVPSAHTKIMAGYWGFTGQFDALGRTAPDGNQAQTWGSTGGYIGAATRLYPERGRRGLDGFVNFGFADDKTHQVTRSLNAGLNYTGLLASRPTDQLGFAVGLALAGDSYRKSQLEAGDQVGRSETNFELTYRAKVSDWLTVQPDLQYFLHTNMDPTLKNDFLFGIHFEIGHLFDL